MMKKDLSSNSAWPSLSAALLLLAAFVWLQGTAINNSSFLLLTFCSFFFVGAGTFLTLRAFAKSLKNERRSCVVVAIIFIVALLFIANSLAQVPRGGSWNHTNVSPENFVLSIENRGHGRYYGGYSQIIYSTRHSVASVSASSIDLHNYLVIKQENPISQNGTAYFFLIFKPYEVATHAIFQETIAFNESLSSAELEVYIDLQWGTVDPGSRVRFEGYDLELILRLDLNGPETELSYLNFTVDTTEFRISVDELSVDSSLQNGLSITLSGILIAVNAYIPGKFTLPHLKKREV